MARAGFPAHRIADDLRGQIISGELEPDGSLPSENELAGQYHTSRPTVRRALLQLQGEGLIYGKQGKGWFVRPKPHVRMLVTGSNYRRHRALNVPGFNAQALEQGMSPRQDITEVGRIARRRIWPSGWTWTRDHSSLFAVGCFTLTASRWPHRLVLPAVVRRRPALEQPGPIKGGAHAVIEDPSGPIRRNIAYSADDITARMPTPNGAPNLGQGVPVFQSCGRFTMPKTGQ